ncbi:sensor histidine kinase [Pseudocolwellia sp. HL-MZ7]|uniref:sensor histidine kinase n=1 Tax=Pseudocolwellia sp. HL-MZ7 TaxID=3400627 RepID=UPI003CF4B67D
MRPKLKAEEGLRLEALYEYNILDTENEEVYDQLTELVANICSTPIALISIIDEEREWFKSRYGLTDIEKPKDWAFCSETLLKDGVFEIKDCLNDERVENIPLLQNGLQVIFYAGAPIINAEGHHIGTLCVIDHQPSCLQDEKKVQLKILAKQVLYLLELRKGHDVKEALLRQSIKDAKELEQKNKQLEQFVYTVSHDLKAPLITLSAFAKTLSKELEPHTNDKQKYRFTRIQENVSQMGDLLADLLELSRVMSQNIKREHLDTELLIRKQWQSLNLEDEMINCVIDLPVDSILANKTLFSRSILNVCYYAIQNKVPNGTLDIRIYTENCGSHVSLFIIDNSLGMAEEDQERAFCIFEQVEKQKGTGMGLCIVKAAMEKHGGEIKLTSTLGVGNRFELIFPVAAY